MGNRRLRKRQRTGATVVEFAVIAPLLFTTIVASIEFGRALMASQSLEEAVRSGCRVAVLRGSTTAEIEQEIDRILAPAGISSYTLQVLPANRAAAPRWAPISVTATAAFNNMTWLPVPRFLGGKTYTASCTLPKEYSPSG